MFLSASIIYNRFRPIAKDEAIYLPPMVVGWTNLYFLKFEVPHQSDYLKCLCIQAHMVDLGYQKEIYPSVHVQSTF